MAIDYDTATREELIIYAKRMEGVAVRQIGKSNRIAKELSSLEMKVHNERLAKMRGES